MEERLSYNSFEGELHVINTSVAIQLSSFRNELVTARTNVSENSSGSKESAGLVKEQTFPTEDPNRKAGKDAPLKFVNYGVDNLFPQNIEKIIRRNSKLKVGLNITAKDLVGLGLETGVYDYSDNKKVFVPKEFEKFDTFYDRSNVLRNYLALAARQLKTHYMLFVLVILTQDGKKVGALKTIPTRKCRLSEPENGGTHELCYVSNYWHEVGTNVADERVKSYEVIDNFYDSAELLREKVKGSKTREFMYVVKFPTEEDVYALADWVSVVEQGWVDSSNDVPAYKRWLLKNLTTINQILYVSDKYFESIYPDWKELVRDAAKKNENAAVAFSKIEERRRKLVSDIQSKLAGIEKTGNMITAPILSDLVGNTAVETKSITIETIKGDDFSGKFNADANEADAQILFSLGIDPSRFGNLTRTDSQGGTGKREGQNIAQAMEYIAEQLLLEVLYFKRDYDAEPEQKKMQLRIRRAVTPTLDQITPSKRELNPMQ